MYSFLISSGILTSSPPKILSKLSKISFGTHSYNKVCSNTITGVFVIGSFNKFPVSIIALVLIFLLFNSTSTSQNISFLLNLVFTIANAAIIIIKATIAANNTVFNGYVPKNNPFFIKISCGFTTYINAKATPPNTKDVK